MSLCSPYDVEAVVLERVTDKEAQGKGDEEQRHDNVQDDNEEGVLRGDRMQ